MREPRAWLLCLLLLGLALRGAASRARQRSMEIRSECRDPSPADPTRRPRATSSPGPSSWPRAPALVFTCPLPRVALSPAPQGPCPARTGGVHFPTREVWGRAGFARPWHENGGWEGSWSLVLG